MPKFQWDIPMMPNGCQVPFTDSQIEKSVVTSSDPYEVCSSRLCKGFRAKLVAYCCFAREGSHAQRRHGLCHSLHLGDLFEGKMQCKCNYVEGKVLECSRITVSPPAESERTISRHVLAHMRCASS